MDNEGHSNSDSYKHFVQRITQYFITLNDQDHWASTGLLVAQLGGQTSYDANWKSDMIRRMCDENILVEKKQFGGDGSGNMEISMWKLHPKYARSFGLAAPVHPAKTASQKSMSTQIGGKKRSRSRSPNNLQPSQPSFGEGPSGSPRAISISSSASEGGSPEPIPNPSASVPSPRQTAPSHAHIPRNSTGPIPPMEKRPRISSKQNIRIVNNGLPSLSYMSAALRESSKEPSLPPNTPIGMSGLATTATPIIAMATNAELEQRIIRCEEFSGASTDNLAQLRQEMMQEINVLKMNKMENSAQNNPLSQEINRLKQTNTEHFHKIFQLSNQNASLSNIVFSLRAQLDEKSRGVDAAMRNFRTTLERQIQTWLTHNHEGVTGLYAKVSVLEQQINGLNTRVTMVEEEVKKKDQYVNKTVTSTGTSTNSDIPGHDVQQKHGGVENLDASQLSDNERVQATETKDVSSNTPDGAAAIDQTPEKPIEKDDQEQRRVELMEPKITSHVATTDSILERLQKLEQNAGVNDQQAYTKLHDPSVEQIQAIRHLSQRISTLETERDVQSLETDNFDVTLKEVAQLLEEVEARVVSIEDNTEIVVRDDLNTIFGSPEGVRGRLEVLEQQVAEDGKLARETHDFMSKIVMENAGYVKKVEETAERIKKLENEAAEMLRMNKTFAETLENTREDADKLRESKMSVNMTSVEAVQKTEELIEKLKESTTADKMVIEKTLADAVEKTVACITKLEEWKGQAIKQIDEKLADVSNIAIQEADEGEIEAIEELTKRIEKIEELAAQNNVMGNEVDEEANKSSGITTAQLSQLENSILSAPDKEWKGQVDEKLAAATNLFTKLKKRVKILEENELVAQKLVEIVDEKLDGIVESMSSRIQKIEESEDLIHIRSSDLDDTSLLSTADTEKLSQQIKVLGDHRIADENRINIIDRQMETVLSEVKDGYDMLKRSVRTFTNSFERRIGEVDGKIEGVVEDVGKVRRKVRGLEKAGG